MNVHIKKTLLVYIFLQFIGTQKTHPSIQEDFDKEVYKWSQQLAETFYHIGTKYYQANIDLTKPMKSALTSFMQNLDAHSTFFDKNSYEQIMQSMSGKLHGIGVHIDVTKEPDDEFLLIIDVIPGGPADKAGMLAKDKIIAIDDIPVKGLTLEEAIAKLKGKKDTKVNVRIKRANKEKHIELEITRDIVQEPNAACYHFTDHNIYYVCLNMFTENSVKQIETLLKKIQQQESKGLILDLRNNTGGLLTAVLDIAGLILEKDSLVVITKGRDGKEIERHVTKKKPIYTERKKPIFILVNNYTASASEILAGALQIHSDTAQNKKQPLVFIVGSKTFGKGSVQEVIPLCNDCALKLTTALYYLPNEASIQGVGVQPDFEIEPKIPLPEEVAWLNKTFGRESALKNTIKLHPQQTENNTAKKNEKGKNEEEKSWQEKKKELVASDYLILNTLRMMELYDLLVALQPNIVSNRKNIITTLKKLYTPDEKTFLEEIGI